MKKELLETIDTTIQSTCLSVQKSLNEIETSGYYPTDMIKAFAELLSARALIMMINKEPYFYLPSDSSVPKE